MPELSERIIKRVEQKFISGHNHFPARGVLASIAIELAETEAGHNILLDSNERIVRFLVDNHAEGEVYALRKNILKGVQTSSDFVRVTSRDGVETGVTRRETTGIAITRANTAEIDY